ncbi:hypothetical protein C8F04DRAFT_1256083 [Mycena alexandri]|uniref:Ribonuclease H1 N-terminal domain-containing protein n=1 Tax=Mycena alexandri TaxID=1745969 RepID=A0AAD6T665_9AGAR|nr:hypothetical protein C8F04DRAFT_1256083 [Mycena alexandri]
MSVSKPAATNMLASEVEMDVEGGKDPRYYCLPPFRGDRGKMPPKPHKGYRYHLVLQGHQVGIFDSWAAAKISLTGYAGSGNKGFDTIGECVEAWQSMCPLGVHPHPVDPGYTSAHLAATPPPAAAAMPTFVFSRNPPAPHLPAPPTFVFSRAPPAPPSRRRMSPTDDVSPPTTPRKREDTSPAPAAVNFAIRGGGIVSASPLRSRARYEELQRRGEEPEMLLTQSFARASLFAMDAVGDEASRVAPRADE